jgi:hypothetical protein
MLDLIVNGERVVTLQGVQALDPSIRGGRTVMLSVPAKLRTNFGASR